MAYFQLHIVDNFDLFFFELKLRKHVYCGYSVQLVVEFEQPKYTIHYIILISIFGLIAFASLQLWRKQSFQHLPEHNESVFLFLFAVGAIFARYLECLCDKTRNNKYFKNIDSQQFNCDFNRFRNKNFLSFQSVDHYLWLTFLGGIFCCKIDVR